MYCVVADDEPRLRQVLVRLMKSDGFTCLEAGDGQEALEQLAKVPAQLLLTDLRMPRLDGIELLKLARERYPDLAVILITAVTDVDVALSCLAGGAMDYLTKPFHLEEVRVRVAQALEKRQLIVENRNYQQGLERLVAVQARRLEELFLGRIHNSGAAREAGLPATGFNPFSGSCRFSAVAADAIAPVRGWHVPCQYIPTKDATPGPFAEGRPEWR